ncbi:peroxiredoxin [Piscinibacter sp.]|uniref:peroxiredoxin n=1 Tax=Piscinibacter sp. TaxID=1903157 RepID=UPI00355A3593
MNGKRVRWISAVIGIACGAAGASAFAALSVGDPAPDFTAPAAIGGKAFSFSLAESLKKGPVVLYFYPKAFTSGCTIEAHDFAEATPKFNALGATVVGMSIDDIATLQKFSVEACRNKFAVAADAGGHITKAYDAALPGGSQMADRISYVISPQGKVVYVYSSADPDEHVKRTMDAVAKWNSANAVNR